MKLSLLVSACALGLIAGVACASAAPIDWAASVNGDFGNAAGAPLWDTGAGLQIPATDALDVELDGGWGGAGPVHDWDGGAHLVWNGDSFRLAATAIYNHFSGFAGHLNESQLGGGAEWYPLSWLTVGAQGGGLVGTDSGYYAGGALKFYPFPDLSLTGLGTYLSLNNAGTVTETDYGAKGEWVAFEEFPLGLTGSYTHANFGGLAHGSTDIWTVGLKLHINAAGEIPLVQQDRTGTLDTIASSFQFHF